MNFSFSGQAIFRVRERVESKAELVTFMTMKNSLKLLILVLFALHSCSDTPWLSGSLHLENSENWKPMIYVVHPEKFNDFAQSFVGKVLDSAEVNSDGSFQLGKLPDFQDKTVLMLVVQKRGEKYPNELLNENPSTDNYFPLVYEPGTSLRVDAEMANFQSSFSIANPSPANAAMLELRDLRRDAYKYHFEKENSSNLTDEGLLEREKNLKAYQGKLIDFADTTAHLLPALMAIRWASPEGNFERIAEMVYAQSLKWSNLYPGHKWVQQFTVTVDKKNLPVLIGDSIPEIHLPMMDGTETSLRQLSKNKKLILLDVWASWCAPCRVENRNVLVPLWERYGSKDFMIVAYGLESSKKAWAKAIEKDGAYRWLHASHVQGDQSPVMEELRLKTIPANFLLDPEGKVLGKNLHGQDLVRFVDEYMVKK